MTGSSLTKLATAIALVMGGLAEARNTSNYHPLLNASPDVESISHEDGGVSMRLHKVPARSERSREEYE